MSHDAVDGVDIAVPVFHFTLRRRIPVTDWLPACVLALYAMSG